MRDARRSTSCGPTDIDIDFGATSVTFTATTSTGSPSGFFTHFTLSDLDFGLGIAGVSVSGFLRADVTTTVTVIDARTLQVDFDGTGSSGTGWEHGNSVTIDFLPIPENPTPVPEPTSLFLLGAGLVGVRASRWGSRSARA